MKLRVPKFNGFRPGRGPAGLIVPARLSSGRVAIGYPYGGAVTGAFHESLMRLEEHELTKPSRGEAQLLGHRLPISGLYIADNRTTITRNFLERTEDEWLLQLDSDIEFPKTLLETLLGLVGARKILAASVPLGATHPSCAFMRAEQPGHWTKIPSEGLSGQPLRVDGVASAILLVHREVFQAIARRHGQCWWHHIYVARDGAEPVEGQDNSGAEFISQGEDLAFCLRAMREGYESWCVKISGLRHHKTLPQSHDFEVPLNEERYILSDLWKAPRTEALAQEAGG